MSEPVIFDPKIHTHLIPSFVRIHIACITSAPYTIATFLPPLQSTALQVWWEARIKEENQRLRKIILQMARNPVTGEEELAGYVMLGMPPSQTGPFRGIVEKLLVSPEHRKKGIARALMNKVEEIARELGRTLLVSCLQ
jgi:GNAT superfamily N-acetyltransferase